MHAWALAQVRRGLPVLTVRKGVQTAAFLGPVAALTVLASPGITPPLALLCMTAALGITSLGAGRSSQGGVRQGAARHLQCMLGRDGLCSSRRAVLTDSPAAAPPHLPCAQARRALSPT